MFKDIFNAVKVQEEVLALAEFKRFCRLFLQAILRVDEEEIE